MNRLFVSVHALERAIERQISLDEVYRLAKGIRCRQVSPVERAIVLPGGSHVVGRLYALDKNVLATVFIRQPDDVVRLGFHRGRGCSAYSHAIAPVLTGSDPAEIWCVACGRQVEKKSRRGLPP